MANQVVMPKLSPTMEEGQLSRWLKKEGDTVSMGEPIAEIDTDKATMEMQALGNGVLRKILIKEGESAPLGQVIAIIGGADEDISSLLQSAPAAAPKEEKSAADKPAAQASDDAEEQPSPRPVSAEKATPAKNVEDSAAPAPQSSGRLVVSPIAARMAAEGGVNLSSLSGSGPGGRIIKRDVEAAMKAGGNAGGGQRAASQRPASA